MKSKIAYKMYVKLFFILCLVPNITKVSAYRAAVFEYFPDKGDNPQQTILRNIDRYVDEADLADNDVDIMVFPEYGLTGVQENPENYSIIIPDGSKKYIDQFSSDVVTRLSHIASERSAYLVVNLLEKAFELTPRNKTIYYNTNLVFNRTGHIITKYRKINLYNEKKLTPGKDIVTFKTDFGVTFGIFICFDILFINPARSVLRQANVTDIVYTHAWFSTMPFYVSTTLQHGYAQANGVNLLASNLNNPEVGNGGSGIYLADGTIAETFLSPKEGNKIINAYIQNSSSRPNKTQCSKPNGPTIQGVFPPSDSTNISSFKTYKDFKPSEYTFAQLILDGKEVNQKVCHNDFCCNFQINITAPSNDHYQLVVFKGKSQLGNEKRTIQFCSVIACSSSNKESCGERIYNLKTYFKSIRITASIVNTTDSYLQPATLNKKLKPVNNIYCRKPEVKSMISHEILLKSPADEILLFGFYGLSNSVKTCQIYLALVLSIAIVIRLM